MFSGAKNTKQQANIGLGLAIAHYSAECCVVSVPLNDSQDYDLVVDRGGKLLRVQVKTCRFQRKETQQFGVLLSMQGGNRKKNYIGKFSSDADYDILFVVTGDGKRYEIPREVVAHIRKGINLPGKYARYEIQKSGNAETAA